MFSTCGKGGTFASCSISVIFHLVVTNEVNCASPSSGCALDVSTSVGTGVVNKSCPEMCCDRDGISTDARVRLGHVPRQSE
jgi:hypothetical protein